MYKLMIKTHKQTGLKYLCFTRKEGKSFDKYKGSGRLWKEHLKQHGNEIETEIIFESDDLLHFREFAKNKSIELGVIASSEWANLRNEEAGGDSGYSHSDESRAKISSKLKGRIVSDSARDRLRLSHLGVRHSEQTKQKMIGHEVSNETRDKLREKFTGRVVSSETKKKMSEAKLGRKYSKEHRENMSKAHRRTK